MHDKILIKGAGEMASAVAHRLFRCGFRVVMTDIEQPTAVRRTVSFCSAIFENEITIEGVRGVCYVLNDSGAAHVAQRSLPGSASVIASPRARFQNIAEREPHPGDFKFFGNFDWSHIPVFVDPECLLAKIWNPQIIIDARMRKRNIDNRLTNAELVIGLGPELEAGVDVHYVVETNRGHCLGRIINQGKADHNTGVPGDINGYSYERVFRTPADGIFESSQTIGNRVKADEVLGCVAGSEITSKIPGVIRGIIMSGIHVHAGQKLGDIDPRGDESFCYLISDKARTISGSVLEIVVSHVNRQNH